LVRKTPDQHDPDWPRYPETILRFAAEPRVSIDLREIVTEIEKAELARIGLDGPFAIITAFDPGGVNLAPEENAERARQLEKRLCEMGHGFVRVDACSPDGKHCECSAAVRIAKSDACSLAAEFRQVAIFWFDGERFWIVGAMVSADPIMLPRNS
jgi:hypothetical protein